MRYIRYIIFLFMAALLLPTLRAQNWQRMSGPVGGFATRFGQDPISGTVYVGTGASGGIYRSTDNGSTWTQTYASLNATVQRIIVDSSGAIHVATGSGYYRSTDGGATFTAFTAGMTNKSLYGLMRLSNGTLFAGSPGGGVYRSTDNGANWTAVNQGIASLQIYDFAQDATGRIFTASYGGGVYASTDNGDHWTEANNGITNKEVDALCVRKNGGMLACTGGGPVFESTDGGASWTNTGLNANANAIHEDNSGNVFIAGLGYAGRRLNGQSAWTYIMAGLSQTNVIDLFPLQSGRLLAAVYGAKGIHASSDGGTHWTVSNTGLRAQAVNTFLLATNGKVWAGLENGGIQHSTDEGATWIADSTDMNPYRVDGLASLPNGNLYASGTLGVYRSTSGGTTWSAANNGITNTNLICITAAGNVLYAGANPGMFRSTNGGDSWTPADSGITGKLPLCISPLANGDLLAGLSSAGVVRLPAGGVAWQTTTGSGTATITAICAHPGGTLVAGAYNTIYRSTDGGLNWSSTGAVGNITNMLVSPAGILYASSTTAGIYSSIDTGKTWHAVNTGLDRNNVSSLGLTGSNYLLAGAYALSVYRSSYAVPVELSSFAAQQVGGQVRLRWSTASESNNLGFRVERSLRGRDGSPAAPWEERGFVAGSGTSASTRSYEFLDKPVPPTEGAGGIVRYRLRQIDADGTELIAAETEVELGAIPDGIFLEQNTPNPFSATTRIAFDIPGGSEMRVRLTVRDILGRETALLAEGDFAPGSHVVNFTPPNFLPSGTFILLLETPAGRIARKMNLIR